jgi:hypothetical protein
MRDVLSVQVLRVPDPAKWLPVVRNGPVRARQNVGSHLVNLKPTQWSSIVSKRNRTVPQPTPCSNGWFDAIRYATVMVWRAGRQPRADRRCALALLATGLRGTLAHDDE